MVTRRGFVAGSAAAFAGVSILREGFARALPPASDKPLRLAVLGTKYELGCELQKLTDRFLVGYPFDGDWHHPPVKVVSLYLDQPVRKASAAPSEFELTMSGKARAIVQAGRKQAPPLSGQAQPRVIEDPASLTDTDLSSRRAKEFGFHLYRSIPEALRCGGDQLAVDAVLCVVEQGDYPANDLGQVLLPQYDFFQQCAEVFRTETKACPYFNHRNLGFSFLEAQAMLQTAKELNIPLMAGTSMPWAFRLPEIALEPGSDVQEALMVGAGDLHGSAYDALEALHALLEPRKGGETGIRSVQLLQGDAVWAAQANQRWSLDLLRSALSRSDTPLGLSVLDGRPQDLVTRDVLPQLVKDPQAICMEYQDGLRSTLLLLNGAIRDFNTALQVSDHGILSTQFLMTPAPNETHGAHLAAAIEQFYLQRKAPCPIQRALLSTGVLQGCFQSRHQAGIALHTPYLRMS